MKSDVLISVSILDADFSCLGKEIKTVSKAGADWIHLDVMDGHFVSNISFGPSVIASLRKTTQKPFDCHLMISEADKYMEAFLHAGCDLITVHAEAVRDLLFCARKIRSAGKKAGVSISPQTHESMLEGLLDHIDLVLLMGVNPGCGGQAFIPEVMEKIGRVKAMIAGRPVMISIDGGVNLLNAATLRTLGADILVAGSVIFNKDSSSIDARVRKLRQAAGSAPSIL